MLATLAFRLYIGAAFVVVSKFTLPLITFLLQGHCMQFAHLPIPCKEHCGLSTQSRRESITCMIICADSV